MEYTRVGETVLGISEEHDAGVCLTNASTGEVLFAANEERYTRKKFQDGFPYRSLAQLVKTIEENSWPIPTIVTVGSIFHVPNAMGDWQNLSKFWTIIEHFFAFLSLDKFLWGSQWGPRLLRIIGKFQQLYRTYKFQRILSLHRIFPKSIYFFDHHTCHAATAALASGWRNSMVVTQDASGDGYCSKVFYCDSGQLTELTNVPFFHSPGHYYEYVTMLFGFKLGREGKVTGLAAYGNPEKTYPIFTKELSYQTEKNSYVNHAYYRNKEFLRLKRLLSGFSREDISAGVQKHLEEIMTQYIADIIKIHAQSKSVKLAVAGGVFANVKLNQKVAALPGVSSLFVYPHMGDGGLAVGAALVYASMHGVVPHKLSHVYYGDKVSKDEIEQILLKYKDKLKVIYPRDLSGKTASLLSQGNVVAIVRGNMEYGPRALGHRSLLYQATDKTVNDWLNKRLKRSEFMPFAPILKKEDVSKYFVDYHKVFDCLPYMTVTLACNKRCRRDYPAVVHVDNTARPQLVDKEVEPFIYEVLTAYTKKTKLRVLINTSYNIHEQPIVRTAQDAIQTFLDGHIDALVLDDILVTQKKHD